MELHKLKYFKETAELCHVTKASEKLNISQPSLTQAIKSLEDELGVKLIEKQGRGIVLTEFGEYLRRRLDNILPQLYGIPKEISKLKNESVKTVKLNILAASSFVIDAIVDYRRLNPDAIFDFEQNTLHRGCDIVISTNGLPQEKDGQAERREVREEKIYLAVPKDSDYAKLKNIDLYKVRDEGFVMLSSSRLFGVICKKFCTLSGFEPNILFESDSPTAVQNIIGTGSGVAFWPEYSWGESRNESVVLLPISSPDCRRDLIFELRKRTVSSEYAEDFYNFLLSRISN